MPDWSEPLVAASEALGEPSYLSDAQSLATFLVDHRYQDNFLAHALAGEEATVKAFLNDYVYVIDALLALHRVTHETNWLEIAIRLQREQDKLFWNNDNNAYYFTRSGDQELFTPIKETADVISPSGNGVALSNLLNLFEVTGEVRFHQQAVLLRQSLEPLVFRSPEGSPFLLTVIGRMDSESVEQEPN
ncbi:MAG: hypothetical protein R3C03_08315 [Pirellulaceae bacterium]